MSETAAGGGPVTPDTTMADVMRRDPNVPVVLMRFHIGGCSMCGFEPDDTVAQVAEDHGVPVQELLAALNGGAAR